LGLDVEPDLDGVGVVGLLFDLDVDVDVRGRIGRAGNQRRWRVGVLKAQVTHILSRDAKGRGLSGIGCTFTSCRGSGCILVVVSHWPLGPSYLVGEAARGPDRENCGS